MPNYETHRFVLRAFCRSPEKTWAAFSLMREGQVEEGLRQLDQLADDDVHPFDWKQIDIEWIVMTAHCLTSPKDSPKANVPRHNVWQ